jgi:hypothetical protein
VPDLGQLFGKEHARDRAQSCRWRLQWPRGRWRCHPRFPVRLLPPAALTALLRPPEHAYALLAAANLRVLLSGPEPAAVAAADCARCVVAGLRCANVAGVGRLRRVDDAHGSLTSALTTSPRAAVSLSTRARSAS